MPVALTFDSEAYLHMSALLSGFVYGEAETVDDILRTAGRDLASAMTIALFAAVCRVADLTGTSVAEQLEDFGAASVFAAEEEKS